MDSAGNQGTDRQLPRGLPRWSYPGIEDLPRHGIWSCGLPTMARPQICLPRAADPTLAHGTYPVMKTTRPAAEDVDMGGVKPRGFPLLSPACSKINRWERKVSIKKNLASKTVDAQWIVTTRLLYHVHDRARQPSRLQGIHPRAW